jgi:MFS family permease
MNKKIERNIKVDYLFRFLSNFSLTDAVWVLYLVYKGMSLWQIGLLEGIFHVISCLSEVPSGALADLFGRKKVIILSRLFQIISGAIMITSANFWYFAMAFVFSAWSYNLLSGSEEALIYDSFLYLGNEKSYYQVNGRLTVIIEVAQSLSTFLGGILAEKSFLFCYIATMLMAAVSLIPCFMFCEPGFEKHQITSNKSSLKKHFKICFQILKESPEAVEILFFYSLVFTLYTSSFFYGQEYFSKLGLNMIHISVIMLIAGMLSCLGAAFSERLAILFENKTKYLASLLIAAGMIGLAVGNLILSVICFSIMSFANALLYPLQSDSLNRLIPSEQRATIISVNSMVFSMFMIIVFPLIGAFADVMGLQYIFAIVGLVAVAILIILSSRKK